MCVSFASTVTVWFSFPRSIEIRRARAVAKHSQSVTFHCGFFYLVSLLLCTAAPRVGNSLFSSGREGRGKLRRILAALSALLVVSMLLCGAARSEERRYDIDIPSMNAVEALNRFAEQTGCITLFSYDLANARRANAVHGRYTLLEGLELLLKDTGLSGGLSNKRVVNISQNGDAQRPHGETSMSEEKIPRKGKLAALLTSIFAISGASAQDAGGATPPVEKTNGISNSDVLEEIVVTGTLLRDTTPVGTNVISVGAAEMKSSGATTTAQFLQTIPQLGSFGNLQQPTATGGGNTVTVNRPNLRNLPGNATAGGSTTLVLMDGHRIVGAGITSTSPDPDIIPPGAIERVEIVPDGGSAVYGADAVAGVMNFITRSRFDGVAVDGHYGIADNYHQFDTNITAGRDWGTGSLYASYNYTQNDAIYGRDRDYVKVFPNANGLTSLSCTPGTVHIGNTYYALPFTTGTAVPGTANQCDASKDASLYPSQHRNSVYAGLTQQLSDTTKIDIRAFYTDRKTTADFGQFQANDLQVTGASPFFAAHQVGAETSQLLSFQFGGPKSWRQDLSLSTWGITPTVTVALGSSWQLRVLGSYGESTTRSNVTSFNQTVLTNEINAGLFNPYDPASSDPAAISALLNDNTYGQARQQLVNTRAVLDGDLFTLPGGAAKLAVGAEYSREAWKSRLGDGVPGAEATGSPAQIIGGTTIVPAAPALPFYDLSRNVKAAFGELVVPIFGKNNARAGLEELTLSAAGRYDSYSDVGHTFNPRFGVTYKPYDWLKLRGSWGRSFNAPSLADGPHADITSVFVVPGAFGFLPAGSLLQSNGGPYPTPAPNSYVYAVRGNAPDIQPQTAKTWSLGPDFQPGFIPGLTASVTYYRIDLKGVISLPEGSQPQVVYQDYPSKITVNPTTQQLDALIASAQTLPFGPPCHSSALAPCSVYAIVDLRKSNLGDFKLSGLDYNLNYRRATPFGSAWLNVNANYELKREIRSSTVLPFVDQLAANYSRFTSRTAVGAEVGNLQGQLTWSHRAGYKLDPAIGFVPQTDVSGFDLFDLYFRYDFNGERLLRDLAVSLSINNVFDTDPPEFRAISPGGIQGFTNGGTLGRLFQVGVSKKF